MNDKKTEVLEKEAATSSGISPLINEESADASQVNTDNSDKKSAKTDTTTTDCSSKLNEFSAQDNKQDAIEEVPNQSTSLASDVSKLDEIISKGIQIDVKSTNTSNKLENLFSDIESSDDSIVYEPKDKLPVSPKELTELSEEKITDLPASKDELSEELEFDPVESDEEFFEDAQLPEGIETLSEESILDKNSEDKEVKQKNTTPMIDEENEVAKDMGLRSKEKKADETPLVDELNLESDSLSADGSQLRLSSSDKSLNLILESSCELPEEEVGEDTAKKDNVLTTEENLELEDKNSSIEPDLNKEESEDASVPDTDSMLVEENEGISTNEEDFLKKESSKQPYESSDASETNKPVEKSEELTEAQSNVDAESSHSSEEIKTVLTDPEIPTNPKHLPDESSSTSNQDETIKTDLEFTPESASYGDDQKMDKIKVQSEIKDTKLEEEEKKETMEVDDDTNVEESIISQMETDNILKKDENSLLHGTESSKEQEKEETSDEEKENDENSLTESIKPSEVKVRKETTDEKSEEKTKVSIEASKPANTGKELLKKPTEESVESMEIVDDELSEIEESDQIRLHVDEAECSEEPDASIITENPRSTDQAAQSSESIESNDDKGESDKVENSGSEHLKEQLNESNGAAESSKVKSSGSIEKLPTTETESFSKSSSDDDLEKVDLPPKDNKDDDSVDNKSVSQQEGRGDSKNSEKEIITEATILPKITPSSSDEQQKDIEEVSDRKKATSENIEKSPKPSGGTEATKKESDPNKTSENDDISSTGSDNVETIEEKSEQPGAVVVELDENKESIEKSVEIVESHQAGVDASQEPAEEHESSEKIKASIDEHKKPEESHQEKELSAISEISNTQNNKEEKPKMKTKESIDKSDAEAGHSIESQQDQEKESDDSIENHTEESSRPAELESDSIPKPTPGKQTAEESVISKKSEESELDESSKILVSDAENPMKVVEIPEVPAKEIVEKCIEAEIIKSKEISENAKLPSSTVEPEIIEIDDDDDDELEKEKESTVSSKDDDLQKTQTTENKEIDEAVKPMDKDEQITTEKPVEKPIEVEDRITKESSIIEDKSTEVQVQDEGSDAATMKGLPFEAIDDEDEPLLMIDTSHKEDNDMDNETATSAPTTTDSSSDGSLEIFYDKECVNYECKRSNKNYFRATVFAMNYFKVSKKRSKTQFVCEDCYDRALSSYEDLCKTLKMKQPLLHGTTFKCQEFVEIIDSSDEEDSDAGGDKIKDENALPKESIEMLEAELEGAIRKVMNNVEIQNQLSWTKQILQQRLTNLQNDSDFVSDQLRSLQRKADNMHNSLYQCPKIKLRQLTPLDLNSGRMYNPESDNSSSIPLPGDIIRNPICVNEQYYAVKTKAIASWVPCKVIEEVESYPPGYNQNKTYKIKFTKLAKYPMFKTVYAKHMAYFDPPNVRLPIGSRVIAYFDATSLSRGKEKMLIPSAFYPGIIAEPLKQSNKYRYLVFYDDGYFQYVSHKDVRLVCQASENVWEDVHHQSREFIHNYLTQYAVNRPMVQTQKGQSMLVDYNGKWIYARVIDVDCSLVQMLFEGQSRSEWIYRGSTRLGPVYKESNNLSQKNTLNATRRRTEPFIRYINGDDTTSSQQTQDAEQVQPKASSGETRSVAKKSVSRVDTSNNNNNNPSTSAQPVPAVRHLNNSTIFVDDDNKPKGKVVYYTARKNLPPRNYVPHICNPSCPFNITHNLSFYSPLAKPLLSGWERQVFRQKSKKFIVYRGPCGKRMRNIEELHRYLRVTDNELNVDNFDFSPDTNCLAEYVLEKCLDISCGKEKMPIPCVNYYDETMPPACEYSAERIPTEGVPLNLDEEFLCGCDCEDDCSDKTKCACWKLTYAGAKYGMPAVPIEMVGYQFKRLYEHVPTGIYECNSRCKCKSSCVNRVVQQPLQSKLQVFKTSNRGWGLRCINDVPRGSFICVYAGQMLTEQVANEGGLDAGDEYFAELDYIEVAEQIKEGYESDVQEPDDDEDFYNPERDDDDTDFRAPGESFKDKEFNTRLRTRRGNKNSTDGEFESQERQVISFEPNKNMDTSHEPNEKPTIRKLFGKDESCYVMDAKVRGNLGRYFNHSCSPNLFVQNVFVDTHDLRFPWVAFFASTHIRAGTELTWNYNYEVGVVPGKVLYCQCGAPNCRQRLL